MAKQHCHKAKTIQDLIKSMYCILHCLYTKFLCSKITAEVCIRRTCNTNVRETSSQQNLQLTWCSLILSVIHFSSLRNSLLVAQQATSMTKGKWLTFRTTDRACDKTTSQQIPQLFITILAMNHNDFENYSNCKTCVRTECTDYILKQK